MQPLKFDALQQNTADFAFGMSCVVDRNLTSAITDNARLAYAP